MFPTQKQGFSVVEAVFVSAIQRKRVVEFTYKGLGRVAEPHVLGVYAGSRQLLVYQLRGESSSGGLPQWRRVNLAEIEKVEILEEAFAGRRPFPSEKHSVWDELVLVVEQ